MPTYQYSCTACGSALEAQQSFSDDPLTECPECGGVLRKVFSAVGVVFKGSGFYRNDSRTTPSENGGSTSNGSSESTKSDSGGKSGSSESSGSSDSGGKSTETKSTAKADSAA